MGANAEVELSLLLVGRARMRALNQQYRGVDSATDVLSFAQTSVDSSEIVGDFKLLGDLVICVPVARAHARRFGLSLHAELAALLTHGILHLLGHTHATDTAARAMLELEMSALAAAGVTPNAALVGRWVAS